MTTPTAWPPPPPPTWGAATNADRSFLQAPFRSGVTIEDYQLDPLVRAIDMARVNLLIADDVGLGKTIEAGLVIQELLVRHRARTVLIICPASLQILNGRPRCTRSSVWSSASSTWTTSGRCAASWAFMPTPGRPTPA